MIGNERNETMHYGGIILKRLKSKALIYILAAALILSGCAAHRPGSIPEETTEKEGTAPEEENTQEGSDEPVYYFDEEYAAEEGWPWTDYSIFRSMDPSLEISGKDNFYAAVNKDWLTTTPLPDGYGSWDALAEQQSRVKTSLMELIEDRSVSAPDLDMVRAYYDLFMDWEGRNREGLEPLKKIIAPLQEADTLEELSEYICSYDTILAGIQPLTFYVTTDLEDSEWNTVYLGPGPLLLDDPGYYRQMEDGDYAYQPIYTEAAAGILQRLGYSAREANRAVANCFYFEWLISENMMSVEESYAPDAIDRMNNHVTLEEIRRSEGAFPAAEVLEAAGMGKSDRYILLEPDWLEAMADIYSQDYLEEIRDYMIVNDIITYMTLLDRDAYDAYYETINSINEIDGSLDEREAAYNTIDKYMNLVLAQVYFHNFGDEEARQEITDLIDKIVAYYRTMLGGEDFLSEATVKRAVEKLDALRIQVAYPDEDYDFGDASILPPSQGGTLMDAMYVIYEANLNADLEQINQKVDPDEWSFPSHRVNAAYDSSQNSICITAAILGGSYYHKDMTLEELYGGIGTIIGHEISHAFDTSGALYDKDGCYKNWWEEEDYSAFRKRADDLISYFDEICPNSWTRCSGELVDTEAIADLCGVKCMLAMARDIEDFDYDLFFRSYAANWRSLYTSNIQYFAVSQDSHPLNYLRVNVILQQFDEFYDTYDVTEGDGMYLAPEDRLVIW